MADEASKQKYEDEKNQIALSLFREALRFAKLDNDLNEKLVQLMGLAAEHVKANPGAFDSSADLEAVLKELRAKSDRTPGTAGGDIVGGGPVMDAIIDLIKAVGGILKDEKNFFFQIIQLIFCGCPKS